MRKRTTQLSVLLAALAFSSMASPVFSGEPLRGSVTVTIINPKTQNDGQLIQHISCPPEKFVKTGIAGGNGTDTNTTHVNNYGTISMASKVDPDSKDWIGIVKDQYEGSRAGAKPNGAVILSDRVYYGDGNVVDHNSSRSNHGIVGGGEQHKIYDYSQCTWNGIAGDGGGATEQIGSVGSFYKGARGGEESHGGITGAGRVTQHHDWIVQQINDGGDDVVNILTTKIPNSAGPQINDGDAADHNSTRSNRGIVDEGRGGGGTDMDVLGRRWRGDANHDGVVTGTDLIVVQQNFGMTAALDGFLDGDANSDGQVTGMDLIEVQQTFGQVTGNAIVRSGLSNGSIIIDDNHFIGPLGGDGVFIGPLGGDGVFIGPLGGDGVFIGPLGGDGVFIGPLGGDGVFSIHNNTFEQIESTNAAVIAAVPEPATIALMSAGLLFMRKTRRTR